MGLQLHYRTWGKGIPSLPILMLHGHPGNADCMAVFAEAVAGMHPCVAPDLRGYGRSQVVDPFEMEEHLEDLELLLNRLGWQECLVLGWSLGGILALELALRLPQRVKGLVLVASAACPRSNHPPTDFWDQVNTGVASLLNWLWPGWEWNIETFGRRSLYRYLMQQQTPTAYRYLAHMALPAYLHTSPPGSPSSARRFATGLQPRGRSAPNSHPGTAYGRRAGSPHHRQQQPGHSPRPAPLHLHCLSQRGSSLSLGDPRPGGTGSAPLAQRSRLGKWDPGGWLFRSLCRQGGRSLTLGQLQQPGKGLFL